MPVDGLQRIHGARIFADLGVTLVHMRRLRAIDPDAEKLRTAVVPASVDQALARLDQRKVEIGDDFTFPAPERLANDLAFRVDDGGEATTRDRPEGSAS